MAYEAWVRPDALMHGRQTALSGSAMPEEHTIRNLFNSTYGTNERAATFREYLKYFRKGYRDAMKHKGKANPAGVRAQVRRLPGGQVQIKIPLKGGRRGNPVRIESPDGNRLTRGIRIVERYGDTLLRRGNDPKFVAKVAREALGNWVQQATVVVDDGKGHRAYNPQGPGPAYEGCTTKCRGDKHSKDCRFAPLPRPGRHGNPPRGEVDHHAATELELYVDNDGDLYRQQYQPILKNLATKKARGIYQHHLAVKLFMYLMESGAKKYAKEFASPSEWSTIFNVPTRLAVAERFAKHFETEYDTAAYNHLLPKKYQPKATANPAYIRFLAIFNRGASQNNAFGTIAKAKSWAAGLAKRNRDPVELYKLVGPTGTMHLVGKFGRTGKSE